MCCITQDEYRGQHEDIVTEGHLELIYYIFTALPSPHRALRLALRRPTHEPVAMKPCLVRINPHCCKLSGEKQTPPDAAAIHCGQLWYRAVLTVSCS